jgi:hypothetical protein
LSTGLHPTNVAAEWLNWIRGVATTAPASVNTKLHTADPGASATTAAAAGDTTRKPATFTAAAGGAIGLTGTNPQWTNGGTTETLTHVSNWSHVTAGVVLWTAPLTVPQTWVATNTYTLTTLGVSITPLMA